MVVPTQSNAQENVIHKVVIPKIEVTQNSKITVKQIILNSKKVENLNIELRVEVLDFLFIV